MACACCTPPTGTKESTQTHTWLLRLEQSERLLKSSGSEPLEVWHSGALSAALLAALAPLCGPQVCHSAWFLNFSTGRLHISSFLKISGHFAFDVLTSGFQTFCVVRAEHSHWISPLLFLRKNVSLHICCRCDSSWDPQVALCRVSLVVSDTSV